MKDRIFSLALTMLGAVLCALVTYYMVFLDVGLEPAIFIIFLAIALEYCIRSGQHPNCGLAFHWIAMLCLFYIAYTQGTLFHDLYFEPQVHTPSVTVWNRPDTFGHGVSPAWQWWLLVGMVLIRTALQGLYIKRSRKFQEN